MVYMHMYLWRSIKAVQESWKTVRRLFKVLLREAANLVHEMCQGSFISPDIEKLPTYIPFPYICTSFKPVPALSNSISFRNGIFQLIFFFFVIFQVLRIGTISEYFPHVQFLSIASFSIVPSLHCYRSSCFNSSHLNTFKQFLFLSSSQMLKLSHSCFLSHS